MSIFKETKDAVMFLITAFVLIFITGFFYFVLGNYDMSRIDVTDKEVELISLRALKCIENNEKLDDCVKTDMYALMINYQDKTYFVNQELFAKWSSAEFWKGRLGAITLIRKGAFYPKIQVVYKNE